jgi:hypothetical protein
MGVTTQYSTEYTQVYVTVPSSNLTTAEKHGVLRVAFFTHTQSGAGDATSSVALVKLPPGRVRLLGSLSRAYVNWTTGSATLDLGWDAYTNLSGTAVVADPNGLIDGLDVDTVGFRTFEGALAGELLTGGTHVFESKDGVVIRATCQDQILADLDDLVGYFVYVID